MDLTLLLLAQAVAGPPPVLAATSPMATVRPDQVSQCAAQPVEDGDIVVCGRIDRGQQYRLKPLTHRYDPVPGPGIGMKVGAGHANLYSTSQVSPDGKPDTRIMVTLKLPF